MTCETVRQRLLEIDLGDLDELAPHLAGCPACSALVQRIRAAEAHLDRTREDFVNQTATLDAQWDRAVRQVDGHPSRARWRLPGLVLIAAALVVGVLALRPLPPEPAPVSLAAPPALAELEADKERYDALDMVLPPDAPAGREQDPLLRELLQQKTGAYLEVEARAAALVEDPALDVRWRLEAMFVLADVYAGMADTLEESTTPTYLDAGQVAFYREKIGERADLQRQKAVATYEEIEALALEAGRSRAVERARRLAATQRASPTPEAP